MNEVWIMNEEMLSWWHRFWFPNASLDEDLSSIMKKLQHLL
jgi:hypothetical protein